MISGIFLRRHSPLLVEWHEEVSVCAYEPEGSWRGNLLRASTPRCIPDELLACPIAVLLSPPMPILTTVRVAIRPLLLIALMLWQSMAWLTPFAIEARGEQIAHMTVHQQDRDHHHHDDASLHLSSDADSGPHFHADDGFQPSALDAVTSTMAFDAPSDAAPVARDVWPPTVFLDGLLRPPSARA